MNLKQLIRQKRGELRRFQASDGIDKVLLHLETSDKHLKNARALPDPDLFTDVIHRDTPVFEGLLKEAYKDSAKSPPCLPISLSNA